LTTKVLPPCRGDIWLVNLDPTIGAEIKKTRPAVVITSTSPHRSPGVFIIIGTTGSFIKDIANNFK
jgi:mRNA-degrading endonuclease toxin of MazEF toxin-antitoxin module